jgi:hypothetical protein
VRGIVNDKTTPTFGWGSSGRVSADDGRDDGGALHRVARATLHLSGYLSRLHSSHAADSPAVSSVQPGFLGGL